MIRLALPLLLAGLAGCATTPEPAPVDIAELTRQATAAETAFAQTMADRDLEAFAAFVADDAIFSPGPNTLRGKGNRLMRFPPAARTRNPRPRRSAGHAGGARRLPAVDAGERWSRPCCVRTHRVRGPWRGSSADRD